ncbi:MAG: DNA/RNA nuclease SfsA [Deltaproteobacteria bacterium]|jgi:sugar fermentation stimulation protein A|nr:DNA/RNA nuclease SfsA [Deltaproteobacteria bacterium]MBT6490249.1 DNA/RNA nuclease SfsA [Deltaproteobacteria bacterium]
MMRFEDPLLEAKLIRRYKRFLADVKLRTGEEITVHCANPGGMLGISDPGSKVLLSATNDPRRKFDHQLEIIYSGRTPVGIHTGRPITVVSEAIMAGQIPELAGYATMRRVPKNSRNSRVDLILDGNGLRPCYIVVESVTLEKEGVAHFPDARHTRGIEEATHLTNLVREGNRAMVIFVAQRSDVTSFKLADALDSEYCDAFRDAVARGVETLCFRAKVSRKAIEFDKSMPMNLES